jgi:hypothetical protein
MGYFSTVGPGPSVLDLTLAPPRHNGSSARFPIQRRQTEPLPTANTHRLVRSVPLPYTGAGLSSRFMGSGCVSSHNARALTIGLILTFSHHTGSSPQR